MSERKFVTVPKSEVHMIPVPYIEEVPDSDYEQASEGAREAFRDMKFGVRIHWGLYSKWHLQNESWPFLKMPFDKKQEYQDLYKSFNPQKFDAQEWMRFFKRAGLKCFAFTTKHHEGFSLFDTKTKVKRRVNWMAEGGPQIEECDFAYSVMDSPFKRDVVRELCDAAREHDIKIDFYFSHPDWYDADFRPYVFHPLTVPDYEKLLTKEEMEEFDERFGDQKQVMVHALTDEEKQRMVLRHREQLVELLTNYGEIDMICLDMWLGVEVWPELKETIKLARKLQPDVMLRARGIGNYGDYYTPEGFIPGSKENTEMPWMVIYPLGESFSYESEANKHKGSPWVIKSLVDTVAKGGNFMVGIGPDEKGTWHPQAIKDLEEAGDWLEVNGEAIYETRERSGDLYKEGEHLRFTRTKDSRFIYAISMEWPGAFLEIKTVKPLEDSQIYLLGYNEALKWKVDEKNHLIIELPEEMQSPEKRPCKVAYAFKIQVEK